MGPYTPSCVASDGVRFFLISLQPFSGANSWTLTTDPTITAFGRRFVLLQSQPFPNTVTGFSWTVVDSYPSPSSPLQTNELDILVGDYASGTSNCQVDSEGNFIWITAKSIAKDPNDTKTAHVESKPRGIRYSVTAGSHPGKGGSGTWSLINTSRLASTQGATDYIWGDEGKVSALFALASGIFVHAMASTTVPGITLGVLTGNNLVQSSQTWSLDPAIYGIPKAIAYTNQTIYVLGSNKVLSLLPVSTTATDVASLQTYLDSVVPRQFSLMKVSDECLTSATLFSSAVRDAFFLFCTELDPTIALRVFVFEYDALRGPYLLPYYNGQSNISAFAVVSTTEKNLPVSDFLFMSMSDNTYGMTMGSNGLYSETVSYVMGDDTTPNNISPSPSLSPPNVDQPSGSGNGNGNGNGNRSGGIVGSIIAAICIIALLYCRFVRKRRVQSKINEIMQRHDGSTHVVPPDPRWATVSNIVPPPPPLPPPAHHFASFAAIPTEEQQDLAQIEMQRMRLGPTPSIVGSSAGVAPPIAPPSTVSISDDHYETSTPQSHSHQYLHPQHQHSTFNRHIASKSQGTDSGEDSYLQHTYSNSPSGSSTGPVASKDPVYPSYAGSGSEGSSYRHHHHPLQVSQSFSSPKEKDKGWADDDSENLSSSPPPPPPPYLAVATQLLNAPSAPSSSNPPPPQ